MNSPNASHRTAESTPRAPELETIVDRFEEAWQKGQSPTIEPFVRQLAIVTERTKLLVELIHIDLEFRLLAGEPARVEQYLARFPHLARHKTHLLELIRQEHAIRSRREPKLALDEYRQRFPWCQQMLPTELAKPAPVRRGRLAMRLNCPHCHNPIEVVDDQQDAGDVVCPSCGSSFRLANDTTHTWKPEKLPTLGKFELLEAVGRGAFGTVYRARDTELDRIVAVKLPRSGRLATPEDEDRFIREARSVAQLRHPNIVSVHATGRSDEFPYIVSEFVEGLTLSDSLTGRQPSSREAAEMIATVADALQYAHEHGVVHRDVKPSNIMIDASGNPHLMDFGLARRDAGEITMTVDGQVLGTPAYMSPEQARGEGHKVDGRSDIYSLGVILYELLTGELPFRGNTRMLLHQVLHNEPRSLRSLNDRVARDLETICLKAMAKEPGRRYAKAGEFAADLRRWLAGEAIHARPVGRIERAVRWTRRNRMVASLGAAVLVVLAGGTIVSSYFAIRANNEAAAVLAEKQRADTKALEAQANAKEAVEAESKASAEAKRATQEAQRAQQITQSLAGMFEESAPVEIFGMRFSAPDKSKNAAAREVLERGTKGVIERLQDQPLMQAALKDTMGGVYMGLGELDRADTLLSESLALREKHLPREHLDIAGSLHAIGLLRFSQYRYAESAAALEEALRTRRKLLGDDHELVDASRFVLAMLLGIAKPNDWKADIIRSTELFRESLAWRRTRLGNTHRDTAFAMVGLASSLLNRNPSDDARDNNIEVYALAQEAIPIFLADPTTGPVGLTTSKYVEAMVKARSGDQKAAAAATRECIEAARAAAPLEHPWTLRIVKFSMNGLLNSEDAGDREYVEKLVPEVLATERKLQLDFTDTAAMMRRLATKIRSSDPARAVVLEREALEATKEAIELARSAGRDSQFNAGSLARIVDDVGPAVSSSGLAKEVEALYREALPAARRATNHRFAMVLTQRLAGTALADNRNEEAETFCRENIKLAEQVVDEKAADWARQASQNDYWVGGHLASLGQPALAEHLFRKAIALAAETGDDRYWTKRSATDSLKALLRAQGRDDELLKLTEQGLATNQKPESFGDWLMSWRELRALRKKQGASGDGLEKLLDDAVARWNEYSAIERPRIASGKAHLEGLTGSTRDLADILKDAGRTKEARSIIAEVLPLAREKNDAFRQLALNQTLARIAQIEKSHEESETLCRESLRLAAMVPSEMAESATNWISCIHYDLGQCLQSQGRVKEAEEAYRASVAMIVVKGANQNYIALAMESLTNLLRSQKRENEVEELVRQMLAASRTQMPYPEWIRTMRNSIDFKKATAANPQMLSALVDDALAGWKEYAAAMRPSVESGATPLEPLADAACSVADILKGAGRINDGQAIVSEILPLARKNNDHLWALSLNQRLARLAIADKQLDEGEKLCRESLRLAALVPAKKAETVAGWTSGIHCEFGQCLEGLGRGEEAESEYRASIAMIGIKGANQSSISQAASRLPAILRGNGRGGEFLELARRLLGESRTQGSYANWITTSAIFFEVAMQDPSEKATVAALIDEIPPVLAEARARLGDRHIDVSSLLALMGEGLLQQGELEKAEPVIKETLEIRRQLLPEANMQLANSKRLWGTWLAEMKRYDEAEPILSTAYPNLVAGYGASHRRTIAAAEELVRLYEATGKPEKAEEYRNLLASDTTNAKNEEK